MRRQASQEFAIIKKAEGSKMLNDNIKVDLHIHSSASGYKDGSLVSDSTIENLDNLIGKLEEYNVALCAITDHNRFDFSIYNSLRKKITEKTGTLKKNLPGIEFDVKLEDDMPHCHVIGIFDDKDEERVSRIQDKMFEVKELTRNDDFYALPEFEQVLRNIGLSVILIAHQRQGLDNHNGSTDSLSGATTTPKDYLKIGFIDSLEYNFPRAEGIVKNSLRNINVSLPTITGSDCHDWNYYPYHDRSTTNNQKDFTILKCLPTFKGLLMAITSFETRLNCEPNRNNFYAKSFKLNGIEYPLAKGINAIIGDNGTGKSLLAESFTNSTSSYYRHLKATNEISIVLSDSSFSRDSVNYVSQGQIAESVRQGSLFKENNDEYYNEIDSKNDFASSIRNYFDDVCAYVKNNIEKNNALLKLNNNAITLNTIDYSFYYPVIRSNSLSKVDIQLDNTRLGKLKEIKRLLDSEIKTAEPYYELNKTLPYLKESQESISKAIDTIQSSLNLKELHNRVKEIIINKLNTLSATYEHQRTSEEDRRLNALRIRDQFKSDIVDCIKKHLVERPYPLFPDKIQGTSTRPFKNYTFCKIAKYNDTYLEDDFYSFCFNRDYASKEKIKAIKTREEFDRALSNYNSSQLKDFKNSKISKFIDDYSAETTIITDNASGLRMGNTPGEISLVYYRFLIQESNDQFQILVIDQPEDDINPERIKAFLNSYLKSIRNTKQIILVTHNPLLVVNLDVDNVIYLEKEGDRISAKYGALEYECQDYSILNLIRDNLDGGYDAIERRLKSYDKDNN